MQHLQALAVDHIDHVVALPEGAGVDAHVGQLPVAPLLQLEGQRDEGPVPVARQRDRLLLLLSILHQAHAIKDVLGTVPCILLPSELHALLTGCGVRYGQ